MLLAELHTLADGGMVGHLVEHQQLIGAEPQYIAQLRLELPLAVTVNIKIEQSAVLQHAKTELGSKRRIPWGECLLFQDAVDRRAGPGAVAAAALQR